MSNSPIEEEMSAYLSGRRKGQKSVTVIDKSIEILEMYGKCYATAKINA